MCVCVCELRRRFSERGAFDLYILRWGTNFFCHAHIHTYPQTNTHTHTYLLKSRDGGKVIGAKVDLVAVEGSAGEERGLRVCVCVCVCVCI